MAIASGPREQLPESLHGGKLVAAMIGWVIFINGVGLLLLGGVPIVALIMMALLTGVAGMLLRHWAWPFTIAAAPLAVTLLLLVSGASSSDSDEYGIGQAIMIVSAIGAAALAVFGALGVLLGRYLAANRGDGAAPAHQDPASWW